MIAIFALAECKVTREQVSNWLKREDDPAAVNLPDTQLAIFLNGLINDKRGKKEGPQPAPEKRINNNIVLTKLKIAFNLKAEDIIETLALADLRLGKAELSAFFRKPDHKHFRQCKDQVLRNFLQGLEQKFFVKRPEKFTPQRNGDAQEVSVKTSTANKNTVAHSKKTYQSPKTKGDNQSVDRIDKTGDNKANDFMSASPNASKRYVNPNKTTRVKPESKRKVLKLKPEDIYKQ